VHNLKKSFIAGVLAPIVDNDIILLDNFSLILHFFFFAHCSLWLSNLFFGQVIDINVFLVDITDQARSSVTSLDLKLCSEFPMTKTSDKSCLPFTSFLLGKEVRDGI